MTGALIEKNLSPRASRIAGFSGCCLYTAVWVVVCTRVPGRGLGGVRMGTHLLSHTCTWGWGLFFSLKRCSPFQVTPLRGGSSLFHSRSPHMLVSPAERRIKELRGWPREANSGLSTAYRIFTFISHLFCPVTLPGTNYYGHFEYRNTESRRDEEAALGLPRGQEGGRHPDSDLCDHPDAQGLRVMTGRDASWTQMQLYLPDLDTSLPSPREGWSELWKYKLRRGVLNLPKRLCLLIISQLGWISPTSEIAFKNQRAGKVPFVSENALRPHPYSSVSPALYPHARPLYFVAHLHLLLWALIKKSLSFFFPPPCPPLSNC